VGWLILLHRLHDGSGSAAVADEIQDRKGEHRVQKYDLNIEIDRCIQALMSVKLNKDAYGDGAEGSERVRQVAATLALYRSPLGGYGGLCQQVSYAIHRGVLNQEPPAAT
jgi:hypothetical protein